MRKTIATAGMKKEKLIMKKLRNKSELEGNHFKLEPVIKNSEANME